MKKTFFLFMLLTSIKLGFAQDTIVKNNGDQIVSKILEITPTEVKYKKFDFQDGPTYVDEKKYIKIIIYSNGVREVITQERVIVNNSSSSKTKNNDYYTNTAPKKYEIEAWGSRFYRYKDVSINENELHEILLKTKDKQIMGLVASSKSARATQFIGFVAIPLGILTGAMFIKGLETKFKSRNSYPKTADNSSDYFTVAGVCLAATITCPIISGVFKQKRSNCNKEAIKIFNQKY